MKATIDRIEGKVAVLISCSDESMHLTLPASILPAGSREGDIVTLTLERDEELTEQERERVSLLIERMRKK
jgi:hypothetical protein